MRTITVEIPNSLAKRIQDLARGEGLSASQFLASAAAEKVAAWETEDIIKQRKHSADPVAISAILARVPDIEPENEWDKK